MEHYKERDRESTGSTLLMNDEKLKDPTDMAKFFSNFFKTVTEKLNIQQLQKGDVISILKDSFPSNFPSIKIIPITEAEMKIIIQGYS